MLFALDSDFDEIETWRAFAAEEDLPSDTGDACNLKRRTQRFPHKSSRLDSANHDFLNYTNPHKICRAFA